MSSNSLAIKFVGRPRRAASFILTGVLALVVLLGVAILWLIVFLLFAPFLFSSEMFGWPRKYGQKSSAAGDGFNPVVSATPSWLMRRIDVLDNIARQLLIRQFGWNLIVARKLTRPAAESH